VASIFNRVGAFTRCHWSFNRDNESPRDTGQVFRGWVSREWFEGVACCKTLPVSELTPESGGARQTRVGPEDLKKIGLLAREQSWLNINLDDALPLALRLLQNLLQLQPLSRPQGRLDLILGRVPTNERPERADEGGYFHLVRIVGAREPDPG
jgi:hypothetical protein